MQLSFLTELFEKARAEDIHTCLDTSGILFRRSRKEEYQRLLKSTRLILLDIKHASRRSTKNSPDSLRPRCWIFWILLQRKKYQ